MRREEGVSQGQCQHNRELQGEQTKDQPEAGGHPDLPPGPRKEAALWRINVMKIYRCYNGGTAIAGTGSE